MELTETQIRERIERHNHYNPHDLATVVWLGLNNDTVWVLDIALGSNDVERWKSTNTGTFIRVYPNSK